MHVRPKTEELLTSPSNSNDNGMEASISAPSTSSGGNRTRRTGLLTVMERPPGKCHFIIPIHTIFDNECMRTKINPPHHHKS